MTRRLKFIHIPKTGGTAVTQALKLDFTGYHDAWSVYPPETAHFISFAVVRDPLRRFLSQYNFGMSDRTFWHIKGTANEFGDYQVMKEMSLDEILADLASPWKTRKLKHSGWWPQSWFICDQQDRVRMHYLLRQEELQDDLNRMLCELGYPMIRLDQINSSEPRLGHQAIQERPDLLEQIQALYQKDYELLGYAPATV